MTVILTAAVLEQLDYTQEQLDRHTAPSADGCCAVCGEEDPCGLRRVALRVFGRYDCLPRRWPGAPTWCPASVETGTTRMTRSSAPPQAPAAHPRELRGPVPPAHRALDHLPLGELLAGGTTEPQAVKSYSLLRAILNTAVREDEILKQNPCDRYQTPERPVATVAQVLALAEQMPPRYVALITVAAFFGLRRCDIDSAAGTVRVPRKLAALKSGLAAGIRVVALPAVACKALTGHLGEFTGADPEALVFTGDKDMPLRTGNFRRAVKWSKVLADAGMPAGFHFHDLRHTGKAVPARAS
ncbi:hypothetical protein GCM10010112_93780 [Actinoplanes lobatus]|uniref:Integrase n=1 Tax=Actinoplanes lobatus TaxID=113568 RepID=A0A7W7HED3_9ACTN|nr:hypothetical protein [Actinoplanes lobatus]MBB4748992.1 integrase [Actinoplanes lobatus]GGN99737.1 hypothetical protein GCM10010112_93780 [Actinoplanes lobatus]GIE46406.1 hypothetical protein Alo02nite_93040 [Actinoplanes lobatus]